jgi:UDP-N-acetylglucosamine--N-acetylmuramyl-(pentapeptide) pyrophosphoryl-undecaprenol N-acetylglucosamine transferase
MKLLIAGGGTGGHVFPAIAIAEAMRQEDPQGSILFVGTKRGIESRVVPDTGFAIQYITARGLKGTGIINTLAGLLDLPRGLWESVSIIKEFRPDFVLGVGGYASGPTVTAAVLMRIPTGVQEQNSVMGTTNKILSRFVGRIYLAWEETDPPTPAHKTLVTGNPVRADLLRASGSRASPPDLQRDAFNILVFGGSLGAQNLNVSLAKTVDVLASLRPRVRVLHQTGVGAVEEMKAAYGKGGIEADVREFIYDMRSAYEWADLVVCRSGAATLAELTAVGRPAIVVPYPYAIGDHQTRNAKALEKRGAVKIVPDVALKNGALADQIVFMVENPETLRAMAESASKLGRPEAAHTIAEDILSRKRSLW